MKIWMERRELRSGDRSVIW